MKRLPIGIQSFEKIRTGGFYYVDKTHFVKRLIDQGGGYYFLSRPRRFGKSLFLDTLRQAFLGKKELFKELWLLDHWEWDRSHPVIRISFGSGVIRGLHELVLTEKEFLRRHAEEYGVELKAETIKDRFYELVSRLNARQGSKVVVLIDEYDKPILDNIDRQEVAHEIRDELKNFYSVLKDADEYLEFVFITGVTKFSKVSIFSDLNQLQDIGLNPEYATICGYTQDELETVFNDRLQQHEGLEKIRCWYDGYSWLGENVYNPFDVLLYLSERQFRPYWFETGTPTFLIKLLMDRRYYLPRLETLKAGEELIGSFDIDKIYPENLLFQTGYLTIRKRIERDVQPLYILGYPNKEVKISLSSHILTYMVQDYYEKQEIGIALYDAITQNDLDGIKKVFQAFFASIPYEWYRKNELSNYEAYYASIFYAYFSASGFDVYVEDATSSGKIDMTITYGGNFYVMEFKVVELEPEGHALGQILSRRYWEKYMAKAKEIYVIGVEFSKKSRNIVGFEWKKIETKSGE